jgi:hypothetical protein
MRHVERCTTLAPTVLSVRPMLPARGFGGPRSPSQPRHFAVKIAVRVGYGPIALKAEPIEETKETGIILA